jgi:hypothetical protein
MKKIFLLSILLFTTTLVFSQEKFRIDYNYVAVYDPDTESWSDWKEGDNTFVININERGDIAHVKANGETVVYKKLTGVEEGYATEKSHHYQIISALDEDGDVFRFQIFDDPSVGLKMMWGNFMIQFADL